MDVYKIGVSLAMTSNAPGVLKALSQQFLHVHTQLGQLQGGLNRVKVALGGAFAVAGGVALLSTLKHVTEHAKELSHELTQIQKFNIGGDKLRQVQAAARGTTNAVGGTTEVDALKIYGSSFSMFGHENALKLMRPVAEFAQVVGNVTKDYGKAFDGVYSMLRAGDLMGKFVNEATHDVDIEKLQRFLELGSKVIQGTHGRVSSGTWLGLAQQGGPALSGLTDQGMLTMAIAAQAMGGQRAGTALTSLYQQMVGGKMTKSVAEQLRGLGLVGDFDVGRGGHVTFAKGALDNDFTRSLKSDPIGAVQIMQRAMQGRGYDSIEKQVPMLFEILGRQTTQRLVHDLLRNMPQILAERERITASQGTGEAKKTQDAGDIFQAERNMKAAWENLMLAIAGPNAENTIAIMNAVTRGLNSFTEVVRQMKPETIQNLAIGIGALGLVLVGAGGAALLAALGTAGWIAAGIIGLGGVALYFRPQIEGFLTWLNTTWGKEFNAVVSTIADGWRIMFAALNAIPGILTSVASGFDSLVAALQRLFSYLKSLLPSAGSGPTDPSSSGLPLFNGSYGGGTGLGNLIQRSSLGGAANSNVIGGGQLIPGSTGGLRASAEAIGGGSAARGLTSLAEALQAAGGVSRFTALNDRFHHRLPYRSLHTQGLALDAVGNIPQIAANMRKIAGAAGLVEGRDYRILSHPHGTGPHAHFQFNSRDAAERFHGSRSPAPIKPVGPPPRSDEQVHIHNTYLDGERIERHVTRRMVAKAKYPGAIGPQDSYGSWRSPGTNVTDAA